MGILEDLEYCQDNYPRWVIIPVKGKRPTLKRWQLLEETPPLEEFQKPWVTGIGCVLEPSGLIVLDFDPKPDHRGKKPDEVLADLVAILRRRGVELELDDERYPKTLVHSTGGGGIHLIFEARRNPDGSFLLPDSHPGFLKEPEGKVELLSRGRMIVLPPSWHPSGRRYRAITHRGPAPVPPLITTGERNTLLTSMAGGLRRRGAEVPEIAEKLHVANRALADTPLSRAETDGIAKSIGRYQPAAGGGREPPALGTNQGDAELLRDLAGDRIRYSAGLGFLVYDEHRWVPDPESVLATGIASDVLVEEAKRLCAAAKDEGELKRAERLLARARSLAPTRDALALARSMLRVKPNDLDAHPSLLNTPTGVLDLRTGHLGPHDPNLLLTRMTCVGPAPPGAPPPTRFLRFLSDITQGHESLIPFLQRLVGYGITGAKGERYFAIFWGPGANGKSVFIRVLQETLGDYLTPTRPEAFELQRHDPSAPQPEIAALRAVRIVVAHEFREGRRLDPAVVKGLTGSDHITTRGLYERPFSFRPDFLPILVANNKPSLPGGDEAVWSRVVFVPFERIFSKDEQDPALATKILENEAPGVLRWIAEGAMAYLERRFSDLDMRALQEAKESYRSEVSSAWEYVSQRLVPDPGARIAFKAIYDDYVAWCQQNSLDEVSRPAFGRVLSGKGLKPSRTAAARLYLDIGIRNETDGPQDDRGREGESDSTQAPPPATVTPPNSL
mgnify:CR=1 FL=1